MNSLTAYIALGSNLADRASLIARAIESLGGCDVYHPACCGILAELAGQALSEVPAPRGQ